MLETSQKVRELFEKAKEHIDLPGFWRFPIGSCEGASLFLGNMLKETFPQSEINYVKGYNAVGEMHFWLEVDGLIYDITADQFEGIKSPIYAAESQPLQRVFKDTEKQPIEQAFLNSDVTNKTYKNSLMIEIRYYLTKNL